MGEHETIAKLNALILAGGFGTRLWPSSREQKPKHLLALTGSNSLMRDTYERVAPLIGSERVYVVTGASHVGEVRAQLPELPEGNIVVEPKGKGTAPCIGLSALYMKRRDPDGIMASLHADHVIADAERFRRALRSAALLAEQGYMATLGVTPRWPETGFGYIERGERLPEAGAGEAYQVLRFTEKPDADTARQFIATGRFYWNSGIFVWKLSRILSEIRTLLPDLHEHLEEIDDAIGSPRESEVLEAVWPRIQSVTIDVGIMERAERVAVVPISVGWNDVGSWKAVSEVMPADSHGNVVTGQHVGLDTSNTLILSGDRLVATIGLDDMVVVDTEDVVLICPKDRAQDVKALVERLRSEKKNRYL